MSVQSVTPQPDYLGAIPASLRNASERPSNLIRAANELLRLDLRLGPKPVRCYKSLSAEEKAELWRTIRQDAKEMAIKHRDQHAIGKPFLCGPCVIGWHEDCISCYCKCVRPASR